MRQAPKSHLNFIHGHFLLVTFLNSFLVFYVLPSFDGFLLNKTHVLTELENLIPTFKPANFIDKYLEKTLVEQFFAYFLFTPGLGGCDFARLVHDLILMISHTVRLTAVKFQIQKKSRTRSESLIFHKVIYFRSH